MRGPDPGGKRDRSKEKDREVIPQFQNSDNVTYVYIGLHWIAPQEVKVPAGKEVQTQDARAFGVTTAQKTSRLKTVLTELDNCIHWTSRLKNTALV